MGCSPSTLPNSSSSAAAAPGGGGNGGNANLPLDGNEKDGSLLFCIKLRRSRMRRCSCGAVTLQNQNGDGSTGSATCGDNMMCNQGLLNPLQTKNESDYEKVSVGAGMSVSQLPHPFPPLPPLNTAIEYRPIELRLSNPRLQLSTGKKDSIVTVAALGNFTHSVVRRATGTGSKYHPIKKNTHLTHKQIA